MILHVYFGDAGKHPIIQNYLHSGARGRHELLRYRIAGFKPLRLIRLSMAMLRARAQGRPSIVQAHDAVSATLATLLWGRRAVFDSHEIYSCLARRRPMAWMMDKMERFAARRAGTVIYPSEDRRDHFGAPAGRRAVIIENLYRPHAESLSDAERRELEQLRGIVDATAGPRYVYAGSMTEVRAIGEIVGAFDRPELAGSRLFLAGARTALLDSVLAVARANVVYFGEVPHAVMTALLASFDAGFAIYKPINANNRLAAPTKLFEYSYYGLDVIANRSAYVEKVRARRGLSNISFVDDISSAGIARACLSRSSGPRAPRADWREAVVWERQLPVIEALYRELEQVARARKPDADQRDA